ncbi:MAG: tail fiber protein [Chthoniobacteraceae bacterium]
MSTPYLAEIRITSFNFAPKGWALCNGQLLAISQNQALFALLGTTYGGNGVTTFGLPNLQGRTPVHFGNGITLGELGGEASHTLLVTEMPAHNHVPVGNSGAATLDDPTGQLWANGGFQNYATSSNTTMNAASIGNTGGSQPHNNLQPYLVLNFIIALQGIFPSQN